MLPLENVRVLDMGRYWAGPLLGLYLAYLGAEVVKLESCSSPDPLRLFARGIYPEGQTGEDFWNRSGLINERNRNKYGLALEITTMKGKEIFQRLLQKTDVLIENLSTEGAEKLGITYTALRESNPNIIWLSMRSRGDTGPEKNRRSFGPVLEACSGMLSVTGYEGEIYEFTSQGIPDVIGAMLSNGLIVAGLYWQRRTGGGNLHIDVSQQEGSSCAVAEAFMSYFVTGQVPGPKGNRHPVWIPSGCYRCGGDGWVTISIQSQEQWEKLCSIMGTPGLAQDSRFLDLVARYNNYDELDTIITGWTEGITATDAMARLQQAGIAATRVISPGELFDDPHFQARGFFHRHMQPGVGVYSHARLPMLFSGAESSVRLTAPRLGEHNHYVLKSWLGLTEEEIADLEWEGILGTEPKLR